MRILYDLRSCQRNRERGVPRYAQNLALALAAERPGYEFTFLYERGRPEALWHSELEKLGKFAFVEEFEPEAIFDWMVLGCAFMTPFVSGVGQAEYLLPKKRGRALARRSATIAYDFIPWRFQREYLSDPAMRAWYVETLDILETQDLILTISEDTRKDSLRLFPALAKTGRIVNINGGLGTLRGMAPKKAPFPSRSARSTG